MYFQSHFGTDMHTIARTSRPLSFKFALVSAAVGASFAVPAQATAISTVPAGFTPVTFSAVNPMTYDLNLDGNSSVDFTIGTRSAAHNFYPVYLAGTQNTNQVDVYYNANTYANPSDFVSLSSIKGMQEVSLANSSLNVTTPYVELVFAGENNVLTRGYMKGVNTYSTDNVFESFTLLDFGLAPNDVPEPGSLALLAAGAAGIGALRRRRRPARAL